MQTASVDPGALVVDRVWKSLASDPRLDARNHPLTLAFAEGTLLLEGELPDVAAMTRAFELAQRVPEVCRVVDRLVVPAPVAMADAEMRELYRNALLGEIAFDAHRIVVIAEGVFDRVRDPARVRGSLLATFASGVVTLEGTVPSRAHARLAGVLAWWIPGTRAVRNELWIQPEEEDCDDEITDAVRTALEAEPLLDAAQVGVRTAEGRVALSGTLPSEEQRRLAERDAWYVLGVREVDNRIEVHRG